MDAESGSSQRERCSLDANSRVRVPIQILAPSNRPVQITENLGDFWRDTYPKLKQQLQRRVSQARVALMNYMRGIYHWVNPAFWSR
jgi:HrpA-like RNA helicase